MASNAEFVTLTTEFDAVHQALEEVKEYTKYIDRDILQELGRQSVRVIKRDYPLHFRKRTGLLYKSITSKFSRDKKSVIITSTATNLAQGSKGGARYGWVLARGATILPKKGKTLTFMGRDGWVRLHKVVLPGRDWIVGPAMSYLHGPQVVDDIDKVVQKKLDKLRAKGVIA